MMKVATNRIPSKKSEKGQKYLWKNPLCNVRDAAAALIFSL